jgi:hypothetical protein
MDITELSPTERVALVSLARTVIRADGTVSADEAETMAQLAAAMGQDVFLEALRAAQVQVPTADGARQAAAQVTRPEAQRLIYALLYGTAHSDGLSPRECDELRALAALWELRLEPTSLALARPPR